MGLDSVELLVSVEELFDIEIPDREAEKINTVGNFVDSVYSKITTHPTQKCLTQIIFYKIRTAFMSLNASKATIKPVSLISDLLPNKDIKNEWKKLEKSTGLKMPELVKLDINKGLDEDVKFWGIKLYKRTEPITNGKIKDLVDWIISINFNDVIEIDKISSKYEVERIICGVISDKMGISINEIELHHSIHSDLGVD